MNPFANVPEDVLRVIYADVYADGIKEGRRLALAEEWRDGINVETAIEIASDLTYGDAVHRCILCDNFIIISERYSEITWKNAVDIYECAVCDMHVCSDCSDWVNIQRICKKCAEVKNTPCEDCKSDIKCVICACVICKCPALIKPLNATCIKCGGELCHECHLSCRCLQVTTGGHICHMCP